ncbi:flagellar hook-basal body complex protein FliE [Glaciihabitans sp. UYNi722]|uniref:flagellar hook-basal body complex protein FliE n=1 Tax=Glaciihabitans sp. UYNi722 TaxID=3156344 RepID=UPI003390AAFA
MDISSISSVSSMGSVQGVTGTGYLKPAGGTSATNDSGFAAEFSGAVDNLQQLQSTSNDLAIKAVTGDLQDIHAATIASTRAQVTMELVAAVRNKGVEAFNDIMRMQA